METNGKGGKEAGGSGSIKMIRTAPHTKYAFHLCSDVPAMCFTHVSLQVYLALDESSRTVFALSRNDL